VSGRADSLRAVPLPSDFAFGVGFAPTQAEGAAPASDWRDWERQGRAPYSDDGNGFATNYRDDLRRFADAGLGHVRLGLEWARLEPEEGKVDPWAIEHHQQVLTAAAEAGLHVWAALVDRSLPGWFALDERGFRERHARSYLWPRHVERCAELFGDQVHAWVPIVRPLRLAQTGYLTGQAPPGITHLERFLDTLVGLHQGMGEAWRVLRGGPPVATAYDLAEVRSGDRSTTTRAFAARADALHWCGVGARRDGELAISDVGVRPLPGLQEAFDIIGFTVEPRVTVGEQGAWSRADMPEDVGALAHRLADEAPDTPLAVLGQTTIDADRLAAVLEELEASVADGVPLRGWFAEPAVDGYEWETGFVPGRGLWDRDRNPRPTVELVSETIASARASAGGVAPVELEGAVILGRSERDAP
jgi:beta-glucosidase